MDAPRPVAGPPARRARRPRVDRPHLDRDTIVRAALEILDEGGIDALSMRSLGRHLGYEAMALYRHVDGREDILEAVRWILKDRT